MVVQYSIVVAIINLTDNSMQRFEKSFDADLSYDNDTMLYNNHHILLENANILSMFNEEINAYCEENNIERSSIDIDEFEVVSLTDRVDVYFEDSGDQGISLAPTIKAYVHPKYDALKEPMLLGKAYDSTTIIWSWPEDMQYSHYLIEQPSDSTEDEPHIIASIPMGAKSYAETGLAPGTAYTRRLVNYTSEQTSNPSEAVTIKTAQVTPVINSEEYNAVRNYDFTTDDSEREQDSKRMTAFHSGVGHGNDLKVYKQLDAEFSQKFKAYYKVSGIRTQRERKYEQISFRYKACLEALEDIEEQEGEVTFDVKAYPREWVRIKDYTWTTRPVTVKSRLQCNVFLRKPIESNVTEDVKAFKPKFKAVEVTEQPMLPDIPPTPPTPGETRYTITEYDPDFNADELAILFLLDCTGSLRCGVVGKSVDKIFDFTEYKSDGTLDSISNSNTELTKAYNSRNESYITSKFVREEYQGESDDDNDNDTENDEIDDTTIEKDSKTGCSNQYGYVFRDPWKYFFGIATQANSNAGSYGDGNKNGDKKIYFDGGNVNGNTKTTGAVTYLYDQIYGIVKDAVDKVNEYNKSTGSTTYLTDENYNKLLDENGEPQRYAQTVIPKENPIHLKFGVIIFGKYAFDLTKGWIDFAPTLDTKTNEYKISLKSVKKDFVNAYIGNPTWRQFKSDKKVANGQRLRKETWVGAAYSAWEPSKNNELTININGKQYNRLTGSTDGDPVGIGSITSWKNAQDAAIAFMDTFPLSSNSKSMCFFVSDGFPNSTSGQYPDAKNEYYAGRKVNTPSNKKYYYKNGNSISSASYATETMKWKEAEIQSALETNIQEYRDKFDVAIGILCNFLDICPIEVGGKTVFIENLFHQKCATKQFSLDVAKLTGKRIDGVIDNGYIYWNEARGGMTKILASFDAGLCTVRPSETHSEVISEGDPGSPGIPGGIDPDPNHAIYKGTKVKKPTYPVESSVREYIYDIDDYRVEKIDINLPEFTFDETVTKVTYDTDEKRAVIKPGDMLFDSILGDKSIYDLIMERVPNTPSWQNGFTETIGTVEENGESDSFLISNLYIQDTYDYHDYATFDPNKEEYEDGWEGSVNVFTDVDTLSTDSYYGDDCYLVRKNPGNYIHIQGFTDAIIFDCNRFLEKELNAYDIPKACILTPAEEPYENQLVNRMMPNWLLSQRGGTGYLSHALSVLRHDPDILFTCSNGTIATALNSNSDCVIPSLTVDVFVEIDKMIQSPVLNYRFNLEDPEANTPFYEIMPEADYNSPFKHVIILKVYYAKNVYISNSENYVNEFGDGPVATTASRFIYRTDNGVTTGGFDESQLAENLYKWTLKEWHDGYGNDNGKYLDEYIWFMSEKMVKTINYYDELPGNGLDPFYGMVNNRYSSDNTTGKKDLRVQIPGFNIPTTVTEKHADSIKIYLNILESNPNDAIVSYKWYHPLPGLDSVTNKNNDYATFSSDSVTYKDVEYTDTLSTMSMPQEEVKDGEPLESTYNISKPDSPYTYHTYMLEGYTDNSDVLISRYPSNLIFDDNNECTFNALYKCIVNATSKWSPRIHNGYYYINQHEYYAYSEFDVKANFETIDKKDYKNADGTVTIGVTLRKPGTGIENYSVRKSTRSELLQDEQHFVWENGKGLTLAKAIDGEFYSEWYSYTYTSPVISFPNELTQTGTLNVGISFADGSTRMYMKVRSYSLEEGVWSDWVEFKNNTVPNVPLSYAYQIKFDMQVSVKRQNAIFEDYLCCYLDWEDDGSESSINVNTITDHISTGPNEGPGMYVSRIIDLGCISQIRLSIFGTDDYGKGGAPRISVAVTDNDPRTLYDENVVWTDMTDFPDTPLSGRYYRYKISIPENGKVYWLHKVIDTVKTEAMLPYVTSVSMTGVYNPEDTVETFMKSMSFSIPSDTQLHTIIDDVMEEISPEVISKGYNEGNIEYVTIISSSNNIELSFNQAMLNRYPMTALNSLVQAKSLNEDYEIRSTNTPFIFSQRDLYGNETINITGVPRQYSPITVEDPDGNPYVRLFDGEDVFLDINKVKDMNFRYMTVVEERVIDSPTKYYELKRNDYEPVTLTVSINGNTVMNGAIYTLNNHLVIFKNELVEGDVLHIEYRVARSFIAVVNWKRNQTTIYPYRGSGIPIPNNAKFKVFFETNEKNNKFVAKQLSMNPVYRTDYKGFIYLTDDHNEPHSIKIWCDPLFIKAGGFDQIDISVEVLDIKGNPVINTEVRIDCDFGILTIDDNKTDMNGVVHLVYESSYVATTDTIRARVLKDDGTEIAVSETIVSI